MDYVALLKFRDSLSAGERDNAMMRRSTWQYPKGLRQIAEYWPAAGDFQVLSIFSAEDYSSIMELVFEWEDVFQIQVFPAISAEEGLKVGPEVFSRLPRMKQ